VTLKIEDGGGGDKGSWRTGERSFVIKGFDHIRRVMCQCILNSRRLSRARQTISTRTLGGIIKGAKNVTYSLR
jgi:hypothetical protein